MIKKEKHLTFGIIGLITGREKQAYTETENLQLQQTPVICSYSSLCCYFVVVVGPAFWEQWLKKKWSIIERNLKFITTFEREYSDFNRNDWKMMRFPDPSFCKETFMNWLIFFPLNLRKDLEEPIVTDDRTNL